MSIRDRLGIRNLALLTIHSDWRPIRICAGTSRDRSVPTVIPTQVVMGDFFLETFRNLHYVGVNEDVVASVVANFCLHKIKMIIINNYIFQYLYEVK